jgi:hypothetical protein
MLGRFAHLTAAVALVACSREGGVVVRGYVSGVPFAARSAVAIAQPDQARLLVVVADGPNARGLLAEPGAHGTALALSFPAAVRETSIAKDGATRARVLHIRPELPTVSYLTRGQISVLLLSDRRVHLDFSTSNDDATVKLEGHVEAAIVEATRQERGAGSANAE